MTPAIRALVDAVSKIMPLKVKDGQDYAEVFFNNGSQAMTTAPKDWDDLHQAYLAAIAELEQQEKP